MAMPGFPVVYWTNPELKKLLLGLLALLVLLVALGNLGVTLWVWLAHGDGILCSNNPHYG